MIPMAEKELAVCDECGSLFFKGSSQMMGLCPECAHILYGYPNCAHHFQNGRCVNCYWDGSKSVYIKKQNQQEETDMPTTEWLNKYEAIKNKLTCKDDLEAHFTENVIGNMAVDVLDIGAVHFPTGQIFACDPLVELEDTPPFIQTIPAGTYPVKICVVPSEKYGDRYACVKVEVSREKPVRYELGMTGKEDLDEELGRGRVLWLWRRRRNGLCCGHPDPGGLQNILGQAAGGGPGHRPLQRPVLRSSGGKRQSPPQISGGLWRLAQLDSAGHGLQPAHLCFRLG